MKASPLVLSYGLRFRFFFIPIKIYRDYPGRPSLIKKLVSHIVKDRPVYVIYNNVLEVVEKIQVDSVRIDASVGVDDAYHTAMSVGLLQVLIGNIFAFLSLKFCDFCVDYVNICADFDSKSANGRLQCIFRFNLAHIIVALIRATIKIRRSKLFVII